MHLPFEQTPFDGPPQIKPFFDIGHLYSQYFPLNGKSHSHFPQLHSPLKIQHITYY